MYRLDCYTGQTLWEVPATATGMKQEVGDCVAGVLGAIEFPIPREPEPTKVRYELTFQPTGG